MFVMFAGSLLVLPALVAGHMLPTGPLGGGQEDPVEKTARNVRMLGGERDVFAKKMRGISAHVMRELECNINVSAE